MIEALLTLCLWQAPAPAAVAPGEAPASTIVTDVQMKFDLPELAPGQIANESGVRLDPHTLYVCDCQYYLERLYLGLYMKVKYKQLPRKMMHLEEQVARLKPEALSQLIKAEPLAGVASYKQQMQALILEYRASLALQGRRAVPTISVDQTDVVDKLAALRRRCDRDCAVYLQAGQAEQFRKYPRPLGQARLTGETWFCPSALPQGRKIYTPEEIAGLLLQPRRVAPLFEAHDLQARFLVMKEQKVKLPEGEWTLAYVISREAVTMQIFTIRGRQEIRAPLQGWVFKGNLEILPPKRP